MSLTNPNTPVSQQDLQDFYHKILPYIGGSSGGSGHTIEDAEGTDLTQRDTLQFGEGFKAEDDDTNEKTVITPDVMQSGDMSDVITPLPSVAPKKEGVKYSTTEQVIGEWIDGKPIYQKTWTGETGTSTSADLFTITNADKIIGQMGYMYDDGYYFDLNYAQGTDNYFAIFSKDNVIKMRKQNSTNYNYVITIQYTKTTD